MKKYFFKSLRYGHFGLILVIAIITLLIAIKDGADAGVLVSISGVFIALLGGKALDICEAYFNNEKDAKVVSRLLKQEILMYKSRLNFSISRFQDDYKKLPGFEAGKDDYAQRFLSEIKPQFKTIVFPMYNAVIGNGSFYKISTVKQDAFFDAKTNIEIIVTKVLEMPDSATAEEISRLIAHMNAISLKVDNFVPKNF